MVTVPQLLELALRHHQDGNLPDAERLYRQVLAAFPDHAPALHLLGVLACQTGHLDAAADLIGRAIAADPSVAAYHSDLGEAHRRAGRLDEAMAAFQHAIERQPGLAEAHNSQGIVLKDLGRRAEALASFERAVELKPGLAEAHNNCGNALSEAGRLDQAIAAFGRAVALRPRYAEAHHNLGNTLLKTGQLEPAIAAYREALRCKPDSPGIENDLGLALLQAGRRGEAIAAYQRALQLEPDHAEALNNLGLALHSAGQLADAVAVYERALARQPDRAEVLNNLAVTLQAMGRSSASVGILHSALQLKPSFADAYLNLGNALKDTGRLDEAISAYLQAIDRNARLAGAHNNLANVLREQGRLDEALESFRRAMALGPASAEAGSNLVFSLNYHPDFDPPAILAEHRAWSQRYAEPLAADWIPLANDRTPDRRLRLGYVSADFRNHPVGQSLRLIFAHHDRRQLEIHGYSDVRLADAVTEELRANADRWRNTAGLSDTAVADQIRQDQIDVLVDLAVHTAGNRLLVFARKPAPVQLTMLGMPATTGLRAMDARLSDRYLDPPGSGDEHYAERTIRLPHSFWCYQPPDGTPEVGPLPAAHDGRVRFGCLNQFAKVSRSSLLLWARVLQAVPGSTLRIAAQPGGYLEGLRAFFEASGIARSRLEFVPKLPQHDYFRQYQDLDLSLDTLPYNGHTSSLDSLWMGVPVITLTGRTAVGRGGLSILSNLGLPELVASTPEQFVELAVAWANDRPRLAALRSCLRQRLQSSSLMDGEQFTADLEAVYRELWQSWCGPGT